MKRFEVYFREQARRFFRATVVDPVKRCNVRGRTIRIGHSNALESYRIASYETKEPETLDWLEKELKAGDVFFDIGANIGLYSMYGAIVQPKARIYAFEPSVLNFARLFRNMLINQINNVVPMSIAVSGSTKLDYFHMSEWRDGAALHGFGDSSSSNDQIELLKYAVFGVTLDELVERHGLPQPNLVKLDVDSIEEEIIEGGTKVLSHPTCRGVLVEVAYQDGRPGRIADLLAERGFRKVLESDWSAKVGQVTHRNCIFAK